LALLSPQYPLHHPFHLISAYPASMKPMDHCKMTSEDLDC
jgi:hypothetical protein